MTTFTIKRTSYFWPYEKPPCEGCTKAEVREGNRIVTVWVKEIETLEDLLAFIAKEDEDVVVSLAGSGYSIEIYDDYRE